MGRSEGEFGTLLREWIITSIDSAEEGMALALAAEDYAKKMSRVLLARATNIKGSSYRTQGQHREALEMFERALRILPDDEYVDLADTHRRMVYVFLEQRRFDDAMEQADIAIGLYLKSPEHCHELGEGYVAKGIVHNQLREHAEAIALIGQSLSFLDPHICLLSYEAALHNLLLAFSLCTHLNLSIIQELLPRVEQARMNFRRDSPVPRLKLRWIESNILMRLGLNKKSLVDLRSIRREFRRLKRPPTELAILSIDIAQAWLANDDIEQARSNLEMARSYLEQIDGINPDVLKAIDEAIEALGTADFDLDMFYVIRAAIVRPTEQLAVSTHPS